MDRHSLESLYRELYREVLAFFLRHFFSREESEDLTQEVFLRVQNGLQELRDKERYRQWVLVIARNVRKNELERRSAHRRGGEQRHSESLEAAELVNDPGPSPSQQAENREMVQKVQNEIAQLPGQQRQVLILQVRGLSSLESAKILNLKPETVRSHLHDARQRLKKRLSP
jgi:RNA polymerase sigma-70 factor (ECF subfamily)